MKELRLEIKGAKKLDLNVEIDGKIVKLKKNSSSGLYEGTFSTEKDTVDMKVYRYLELNSPLWFLTAIFYFLVSIFGIFDSRKEKSCIVLDCHFEIKLDKDITNLELWTNPLKTQGRAFELSKECDVKEIKNEYYFDAKAKKKIKWLRLVKFILFVGIVIGLVFLIQKVIVG